MPTSISAAKRVRQNEKRRIANKARRSELKTIRKQLQRAVHDGKSADAQELLRKFTQQVDRAASKGVLHRNAASRVKSRLAKQVGAVAAA